MAIVIKKKKKNGALASIPFCDILDWRRGVDSKRDSRFQLNYQTLCVASCTEPLCNMSFAIVYLRQNFSSSVIGVHRDVRKRRSISAYHKCSFLQVERSQDNKRGNEEGAGTRLTRLNYYLTLSCDHFLPLSWNRTKSSTDSIKIRLDDSSNLSHQILFKFHKTVSRGWFGLVILIMLHDWITQLIFEKCWDWLQYCSLQG